jgi:hypothetical protein
VLIMLDTLGKWFNACFFSAHHVDSVKRVCGVVDKCWFATAVVELEPSQEAFGPEPKPAWECRRLADSSSGSGSGSKWFKVSWLAPWIAASRAFGATRMARMA